MSYNVITDPSGQPVTKIENWAQDYMDAQIEILHDQSMLTLATPDDSLLVVGPPRLSGKKAELYVVGMVNSFNYSESSQVQPVKAIGSRRHLFSKTNAPVSGSIGRMVVLGPNLYRALYAMMESTDIHGRLKSNQNFSLKDGSPADSTWYANLEEDLFRYPIGLGVIYKAPIVASDGKPDDVVGAEYLESCVIVNRAVGMQSGSAMIMEQVSFMADRVIPWKTYKTPKFGDTNPAKSIS